MAVETPHTNLPSRILNNNREMMKQNHQYFYNTQIGAAISFSSTMPESLLPFHQTPIVDPNSMHKADSGLTYHIPLPRKRVRDSISEANALPLSQKNKLSYQSPFLDHNLLYQLQSQQADTDHFIAQHMQKVRRDLEEQIDRQSRMLISRLQEAMMKKLKEKDEEFHKIENINWMLEERMKSLYMENQIWKELAETNEATAKSLRNNLQQVLAAQITEDHRNHGGAEDDAESSCASNHQGENDTVSIGRVCSKCRVREVMVLLMPCRHLCLCTICGSNIHNCPLCQSSINASIHVNLS